MGATEGVLPGSGRGRVSLTTVYLLGTPLFAICDWIFHWNVRVAGLDGYPALKNTYYAVCFTAGAVTSVRPSLSRAVGLAESSINILLLVLGVMLPYWSAIGHFTGEEGFAPFTVKNVLNFVISGFMWLRVFYGSIPESGVAGRPL